ncbi:MAG TPA: shikimate kinase [Geopsychrobacteraceae bacterium]|nr:shikimate kinase [Geopsychrobacteraceae bacterium]
MEKSNLVLIGMPGVGKSTVGVVLAKHLGLNFIDTDLQLQAKAGCRLQQIISERGLEKFLELEEKVILDLRDRHSVIATGGSVIYSPFAMDALRRTGHLIYLKISLQQLQQRIDDMGQRGVVIEKNQSFSDLYDTRTRLYEQYAELTVNCDSQTANQVVQRVEIAVAQITGVCFP